MTSGRLLVVEHQADCPPGWLGEWLLEDGAALDVRRPYLGQPLPTDLAGHGGLMVLGGSMGADDESTVPWLADCKSLTLDALDRGTPTLGVCLGHQLVASALGGRVGPNPGGQQIGVLDIGWSPEVHEDPLFEGLAGPARALQWNDDVVLSLPEGAVALARTTDGVLQAARFAPAVWGVQWHPEVDEEIVAAWAEEDRARATPSADAPDLERHVAAVRDATPELRASWRGLATGFWRQCRDRGGS